MNVQPDVVDQVYVPGDLVTITSSDQHRPRVTIRGVVRPGEYLAGQTRVLPVQFGRCKIVTFVSLHGTPGLPHLHVTRKVVKWFEEGETLAGELVEQSGRRLTVKRQGLCITLDRTRAVIIDHRDWLRLALRRGDWVDVNHAVRAIHVLYPQADLCYHGAGKYSIASPGIHHRIPLSKACKGQRRAWLAAWKSIVARSRLTPDDL